MSRREASAGWVSSRSALRAFLVMLGLAALLGILSLTQVLADYSAFETSAVMAVACVLVMIQSIVAERWRFVRWMRMGMLATVLASAVSIFLIWTGRTLGLQVSELLARFGGALGLVAFATTFGGVILGPRARSAWVVAVQRISAGLTIFWSLVGVASIVSPDQVEIFMVAIFGDSLEWLFRSLTVSMVVAGAGAIALPVLLRLQSMADVADHGTAMRGPHARIRISCPRCATGNDLAANMNEACAQCGLALRVQVEEPRCACGYLLYKLEGESCPECGRPVAQGARWAEL